MVSRGAAALVVIEGLAERDGRMPVFGYYSFAARVVVLSHIASLTAYYANRNMRRWSRRS